jgi:hypothetical protein
VSKVLEEIAQERARQDAKWGEQNHPSVSPLSQHGMIPNPIALHLPISADCARQMCERRFREGNGSWTDIALEEFCEAVEVGNDDAKCRAELVQLAAVVAAWIECIDRRREGDRKK